MKTYTTQQRTVLAEIVRLVLKDVPIIPVPLGDRVGERTLAR